MSESMNPYFYVLAGSQGEARRFAAEQGISQHLLRYVWDEQVFRGIISKGTTLWVCGHYYTRQDSQQLLEIAKYLGFIIKFVED